MWLQPFEPFSSLNIGKPKIVTLNLFRKDIQGLRAVAVLFVVAFHALLPIDGGFLGVDIFFVISGFIITELLYREFQQSGALNLRRFAFRRFRRLMPALAFYVLFVLSISLFLIAPYEPLGYVAKNASSVIAAVSNFYVADVGYFEPSAEVNPFLNAWSLSVEQQFYVLAPFTVFLLFNLKKTKRSAFIILILLIFLGSLSLSLLFANGVTVRGHWALGSFFSPVVRAWEFMVGMGVAYIALVFDAEKYSTKLINFCGFVGLSFILFAVFYSDPNLIWPNAITILVVLGTGILLLTGLSKQSIVNKFLSSKTLVWLGDRSYSLYLFHWPVIVFTGLLFPRTVYHLSVAAVFSLPIALFSYNIIEQKFRAFETTSKSKGAVFFVSIICIPISFAMLVSTEKVSAQISKMYADNNAIMQQVGEIGHVEFNKYLKQNSYPCLAKDYALWANKEGNTCRQSNNNQPIGVALLGDSHAEHAYPGLNARANVSLGYFMQNSVPVLSNQSYEKLIRSIAKDDNIKKVVFMVRWANKGVDVPNLAETAKFLIDNEKNVFFSDGIPDYPFGAFGCKFRRALFLPNKCTIERNQHDKINMDINKKLDFIKTKVPGVVIIKTANKFCNKIECSMVIDDELLYRDNNHLNLLGSQKHAAWLYPNIL